MMHRWLVLSTLLVVVLAHKKHELILDEALQPSPDIASIDNHVKGYVQVDAECSVTVSGLRIDGHIELRYVDDASVLSSNILEGSQALPYSSEHDVPTSTWTVTSAVDRCAPPPAVIVWCGSCTAAGGATLNGVAIAATSDRPLGSAAIVVVLSETELLPLGTTETSTQRRSLLQTCTKTITVDGKEHTFDHCIDVAAIEEFIIPFNFLYTVKPGSNGTEIHGAMVAETKEWVGVGFPKGTGGMIWSSSIIAYVDATAPSGATVDGWRLTSYEVEKANAGKGRHEFPLSDLAASLSSEGIMTAVFTVELPDTLNALTTTGRRMIYAIGKMDSTGLLGVHYPPEKYNLPFGRFDVKFQYQGNAGATPASGSGPTNGQKIGNAGVTAIEEPDDTLMWAHAWLMTIGWGVLIPMGAVVAHSFKDIGATWYVTHYIFQGLGLVLGAIGFALIFVYAADKYPNAWEVGYTTHRNIGVAVVAAGLVQLVTALMKPDFDSKLRGTWHLWHAFLGLSSIALAISNIYYGLIKVKQTASWTWITYTVILSIILAVALVKDVWRLRKKKTNTAYTKYEDEEKQAAGKDSLKEDDAGSKKSTKS